MTTITIIAPHAPWPYGRTPVVTWTPRPDAPAPTEPSAPATLEARKAKTLAMLHTGAYSLMQLAKATGGTSSGTSKLMHRLIAQGAVTRTKLPGGVTAPYVYSWRKQA